MTIEMRLVPSPKNKADIYTPNNTTTTMYGHGFQLSQLTEWTQSSLSKLSERLAKLETVLEKTTNSNSINHQESAKQPIVKDGIKHEDKSSQCDLHRAKLEQTLKQSIMSALQTEILAMIKNERQLSESSLMIKYDGMVTRLVKDRMKTAVEEMRIVFDDASNLAVSTAILISKSESNVNDMLTLSSAAALDAKSYAQQAEEALAAANTLVTNTCAGRQTLDVELDGLQVEKVEKVRVIKKANKPITSAKDKKLSPSQTQKHVNNVENEPHHFTKPLVNSTDLSDILEGMSQITELDIKI